MNWATGHNMPGYMPESDVFITSDWADARDALIADLERAADQDSDFGSVESVADEYATAIAELRKLTEHDEWGCTIGNTAWWLNMTDESPEDDA